VVFDELRIEEGVLGRLQNLLIDLQRSHHAIGRLRVDLLQRGLKGVLVF
jgi:hypothetical protein